MVSNLRAMTSEQIREFYGLPAGSKILGYAVHLPETDEFLAQVKSTRDVIQRLYARTPEMAKVWPNVKRAMREAKAITYKYAQVMVVLVCDTGDQIAVIEVASANEES